MISSRKYTSILNNLQNIKRLTKNKLKTEINSDTKLTQEEYSQITDLFEPPTNMILPSPAVSTGSPPLLDKNTQKNNYNCLSTNENRENNSNNSVDDFKNSKEDDGSDHSYEEDSEDSEDLPIFYSSLTTTTRGGLQTPPLTSTGLLLPHDSSTPKETTYSCSPTSQTPNSTSTTISKHTPMALLSSYPTARHVSLSRQKTVLEPGGSLHVSNLHLTAITEAILYNHFSAIGAVSSVKICRDSSTSRSLGYGYVNYYKREHARQAMETLNFKPIAGATESKEIRIAKAFAKGQLPPPAANVVVKGLPITKAVNNNCNYGNANQLARALWKTFTNYGEIVSVLVVESDGRGYVQFETEKSAQSAIAAAGCPSGVRVDGYLVRVEVFVGRDSRESVPNTKNNKSQQSTFQLEEKSQTVFSPGLAGPSVSADLYDNPSNYEHPGKLPHKTLFVLDTLSEPLLPVNSSPTESCQVSNFKTASMHSNTSIESATPSSVFLNQATHAQLLPLLLPRNDLSAPAPAHNPRHAPLLHGQVWTCVKILNLPPTNYSMKGEIETLVRELCLDFGGVMSVHVANKTVSPGNSNCGPVYVRFRDAYAAVVARNVISGMQLAVGKPLQAFLLKSANASEKTKNAIAAMIERVPPMVVVKYLGNKMTTDAIGSILQSNCPTVYDKLFTSDLASSTDSINNTGIDHIISNGNDKNTLSSNGEHINTGFALENPPIRLYPEHGAATIVCPDRTVAATVKSALDRRQTCGTIITAFVARTFDEDHRSSPYYDKSESNAGQRQEDQVKYPSLPEQPVKCTQGAFQTPSSESEPKLQHVPTLSPLPQRATNLDIQHIPRPFIYFPVSIATLSFSPRTPSGLNQKTHPAYTDTVSPITDKELDSTILVGYYYFGVDANGVSYHVQHPMPPSAPASLVMQSDFLEIQNNERLEASNLETINEMDSKKPNLLKAQKNSIIKCEPNFEAKIKVPTNTVSDSAGVQENWTSAIALKTSSVFDNSKLNSSLQPQSQVSESEHSPLSLPVMISAPDTVSVALALKPLRSRYTKKQDIKRPQAAADTVESFNSVLANVADKTSTGGTRNTRGIPFRSVKKRQHKKSVASESKGGTSEPVPMVVAEGKENGLVTNISANSKDGGSKSSSYRPRRKGSRNRHHDRRRRADSAASVVVVAADETLLLSSS